MTVYSLNEAQSKLADLIADAIQGKTILIQSNDEKVVQLVLAAFDEYGILRHW